jgi:arylsulfatase A-like enzyme
VWLLSDNGPYVMLGKNAGNCGPFTGTYAALQFGYTDVGKASTWECGFRMPAAVWWPGISYHILSMSTNTVSNDHT